MTEDMKLGNEDEEEEKVEEEDVEVVRKGS